MLLPEELANGTLSADQTAAVAEGMVYGLDAEEETTDVGLDEHTAATGEFLGRSVDRRL